MDDLRGKVALVAGASRGIGRSVVLGLARAGASVVATTKSERFGEDACDVGDLTTTVSVLTLDVRDPDASANVVSEVVRRHGRVDVLVANAGVNPYFTRPERLTPEMWDTIMGVNLRGIFFLVQAAGRQMIEQGSGSIVVVSSITARIGTHRGLPYVASKGGLDSMTRTLAVEWAQDGIRVNGVAPGYIMTDLTSGIRENPGLSRTILDKTPMGRFGTCDEVANLVCFLASDLASYVTGQTFAIDGGMEVR